MAKIGFFCILALIATADILTSGFGFASMVLLFLMLKIQADQSAAYIMKYGVYGPNKNGSFSAGTFMDDEPYIASIKTEKFDTFKEPFRPEPQKPILKLVENKETPKIKVANASKPEIKKPELKKPEFKKPNFKGQPFEVLGIKENASTILIHKAFRFWVKQYHPDHNVQTPAANAQTFQLTEAKRALLKKRKLLKMAA